MANQPIPEGKTLKNWLTPEFPVYKRGRAWYIIASLLAVVLLIYAFSITNFLFVIIILIFAVILTLTGLRQPEMIEVKITETGVRVDENFFLFRDLERFSIVYQPPTVKCLYLETKENLRPRVSIQLEDQDPSEVHTLLLEHVTEDLERIDEPIIEFLGRILKI